MFANLSKLPIVTDVTYKALKIGIICTSVMYSPETRKHNVIFQAIMNGSTKKYFEEYFKTLFTALAIDFVDDNSLDFMMDFSSAQIYGFLTAITLTQMEESMDSNIQKSATCIGCSQSNVSAATTPS